MGELRELKASQLDALREIANMGAGHAATALSQLTDSRVMIDIPEVHVPRFDEIPDLLGAGEEPTCSVSMKVFGDITGRTVIAFREPVAWVLVNLLVGRGDHPRGGVFGEVEESALKETANILGGAYLSALSDFLGFMLLPSVPTLTVDRAEAVFSRESLELSDDVEHVICIENAFFADDLESDLQGQFFLLPDPPAVNVILEQIRIA